jgi:hypothetical protein
MKLNEHKLIEEARRQSLLASKSDSEEEIKLWQDDTDTSGWI